MYTGDWFKNAGICFPENDFCHPPDYGDVFNRSGTYREVWHIDESVRKYNPFTPIAVSVGAEIRFA